MSPLVFKSGFYAESADRGGSMIRQGPVADAKRRVWEAEKPVKEGGGNDDGAK